MAITNSLGGLTTQTVKQLFAQPNTQAQRGAAEESKETPLQRIQSLIRKHGGDPNYETLAVFFDLAEEDQKAVAEQVGGWVAYVYDQMEGYAEHGLKDVVIAGIRQAAAENKTWTGNVKIFGQTYGVGIGTSPAEVRGVAQLRADSDEQRIGLHVDTLRHFLDNQADLEAATPGSVSALPDRLSTESARDSEDASEPERALAALRDLGVKGLALTRGSDGTFRAGSFSIDHTGVVLDWAMQDHAYSLRGGGTLDGWSVTTQLPRVNLVA